MRAFAPLAGSIRGNRHAVLDTHPLKMRETESFDAARDLVTRIREFRDLACETWFEALYGRGPERRDQTEADELLASHHHSGDVRNGNKRRANGAPKLT